jgi:predicted anti-sigma-YlaC factor YlaD
LEALSAMADGEEPPLDHALVDAHVRRCADCRSFRSELEPSTATAPQSVTAGAATTAEDLATMLRRQAARLDRQRHPGILRYLLALLGAQIVVFAVPALATGGPSGAHHDVRHIGAFAAAYGMGLVAVALRPARARTMLAVGQVLVLALVVSAIVDVADGSVSLLAELAHLPELASVLVLWLLVDRGTPIRSLSRRRPRSEPLA